MRIAVISDTHSPRFWKRCPPAVAAALDGVDLILHAGDVCLVETLEELSAYAPVLAVRGNNDGPVTSPRGVHRRSSRSSWTGVRLAMLHDSGPSTGRGRRLRRRFPDADLVVFGHSHIPWNEVTEGQVAFNPGSPTDKRRQPQGTLGELILEDGVLVSARIFPV